MKDRIKVFVKRPGMNPEVVTVKNTLQALQELVGGHIETFTLSSDCVLIFDEEGYIKQLPYTAPVYGIMLRGPLVFAGVSGDEFDDVPFLAEGFRHMFPQLWEVENGDN